MCLALEAAADDTYRCGLTTDLAVGDYAKGGWAALSKIYPEAVKWSP